MCLVLPRQTLPPFRLRRSDIKLLRTNSRDLTNVLAWCALFAGFAISQLAATGRRTMRVLFFLFFCKLGQFERSLFETFNWCLGLEDSHVNGAKVVNQTRPSSIISQPANHLIELFQVMCEEPGQCAFLTGSIQCTKTFQLLTTWRFISQFRVQHALAGGKRQNSHGDSSYRFSVVFTWRPQCRLSYHQVAFVVVFMNDRGNSIAPNLRFPLKLPLVLPFL